MKKRKSLQAQNGLAQPSYTSRPARTRKDSPTQRGLPKRGLPVLQRSPCVLPNLTRGK
jgi:hypothetical protein